MGNTTCAGACPRVTRLIGPATAVLVVGLAASCSGTSNAPTPQPNQPSSAATASPSALPSDDETQPADGDPTASASGSRAPDPTAPATVAPAGRPTTVKKRVPATAGSFTKAVRWTDGLRLEIVSVRQGKTGGKGKGARPGAPETTIALELTNNSSATVDARSVVVTTTYADGAKHRLAAPVYDAESRDFSDRVKAKSNATATYAYSIPKKRLSAVTLTVDLDAKHDLARFTGSVR